MNGFSEAGVPDTYALRRRVLFAGLATLVMFLVVTFTLAWLDDFTGRFNFWVVPLMVLVYLTVTRPLLRPVREAIKLRRRLAYQAWLDDQGKA